MTLAYVLTDNNLTWYCEGKSDFIDSRSPDFSYYKNLIEKSKGEIIESFERAYQEHLELYCNGTLQYKEKNFYYQGIEVPQFLPLKDFIENNLPYQPLLKFLDKYRSCDLDIQEKLTTAFSDRKLSLTWEGDLILYKRASWNSTREMQPVQNYEEFKKIFNSPFEPGAIVRGEELICGSLGWNLSHCPDTGAIFDVVVNPLHITSIGDCERQEIKVREYLNLSKLPSRISEKQKEQLARPLNSIETLITDTGYICIRKPYDAQTLASYLVDRLENKEKIAQQLSV